MKTENIRSAALIVVPRLATLFVVGVALLLFSMNGRTIESEGCCNKAMYKSIPQWTCGNPPTVVPKREDINTGNEIEDLKLFHMAVANFRARSYLWMVCTTNFIHKYPKSIDHWGRTLIKENEVIVQ